jgi:Tol biopolymer transport system component
MKRYTFITLLTILSCLSENIQAHNKFPKPDTTDRTKPAVTLFIPGAVASSGANNLDAAFTPDGNSVYFAQSSKDKPLAIMFSQITRGKWSVPQTVPFSGTDIDLEPAFDPHGRYLIFASSRPTNPGGAKIDGHYNGEVYPGKGGNLWKVELTKKGWGKPEVLPATINSDSSVFSPAVAGDGSLYFMRADNGGIFHIYRSQMKNGQYGAPVQASFTVNDHGDFDPAVAPDESFIIFSSGRAPAPHTTDLFISFRTANGDWGAPIDLRSVLSDKVYGVEARLSPDCKTLYFTNSLDAAGIKQPDSSFIWQVDISDVLKTHGVDKISARKSSR